MNYTELSKEISYALRHAPWEYELEMDEEGRVPIGQLISALRINPKWENVVDALRASDDGIKFYYGNEKVWLADRIPGKYIIEESNAGIAWL
jgi:RNA:NAD 2'-phosphotransferase (TPT1/KptA family)